MIIWKKNYHKEFDPSQLLNKLKPFEKHYELWEDYMNQYSKTWHYFLGSFYLASFQIFVDIGYWVRPYLNVKVAHCSNLSAFENFKNVQEIGLNQWPRNTEPQ